MKRFLAAAFLIATPLGAQDFSQVEISTVPVTDGIYMLMGSGGNIGVSVGADGTFIVDDQFAPLTEKIVAAIGELTDDDVDFVVNTHWHYDHTDGNENFGRAGALIVAHENSRVRMESDQTISLNGRLQEAYDDVGLPKITFYERMTFHYNGDEIQVLHFGPGHTDGDAIIYFKTSNVVHTGDMYVRYGLPFIDQPNGGSTDGMIAATWALAGLIDEETIIIPGHGQLANRADLLEYREMLVTIRGRLVEAIEGGASEDDIVRDNPADGFAFPSAGTERWLRAAYKEYAGS